MVSQQELHFQALCVCVCVISFATSEMTDEGERVRATAQATQPLLLLLPASQTLHTWLQPLRRPNSSYSLDLPRVIHWAPNTHTDIHNKDLYIYTNTQHTYIHTHSHMPYRPTHMHKHTTHIHTHQTQRYKPHSPTQTHAATYTWTYSTQTHAYTQTHHAHMHKYTDISHTDPHTYIQTYCTYAPHTNTHHTDTCIHKNTGTKQHIHCIKAHTKIHIHVNNIHVTQTHHIAAARAHRPQTERTSTLPFSSHCLDPHKPTWFPEELCDSV